MPQGIEFGEPQTLVVAPVDGQSHPSRLGALCSIPLQGNGEVIPVASDAIDDALCDQAPFLIEDEYAKPASTTDEDLEIIHPSRRVERAHLEGFYPCGHAFLSVGEQPSSDSRTLRPTANNQRVIKIYKRTYLLNSTTLLSSQVVAGVRSGWNQIVVFINELAPI